MLRRQTLRPLDRCGREDRDRLADHLLPEEGAEIKERVFLRAILIGKRVVATARSWSLDDSAAGMDGARHWLDWLPSEVGDPPPSDQDTTIGGFCFFFSFPHLFALFNTARVPLDNVITHRTRAGTGRTDTDDRVVASPHPALSRPARVCSRNKTKAEKKKNELYDLDHSRAVHPLPFHMWLLPQCERDEPPSRKSRRLSHVMFGVILPSLLHPVFRRFCKGEER